MADGVARRGISRGRITVIPNGCDLEVFDVPPAAGDAYRAEATLPPGAPLIVYAGALGAVNGVEWLADVAAELRPLNPDARFLVVGRGAGRDALLERARERGVLDVTLRVRPPVRKREMPALLAAATVATSLFRPIPEMEANSAHDARGAAEQLAAFLADGRGLARAGAAARGLAETRFDRDALAAEFASVLERVARNGRG
jgi:glycosyltransferase involved in cell wall biosynthesis